MMVPSKVEKLLDLSNFSYVLVNAWQFLAMVNNTLQYLAMLDHYTVRYLNKYEDIATLCKQNEDEHSQSQLCEGATPNFFFVL